MGKQYKSNKLVVQQKAEELLEYTLTVTDNVDNFSKRRRFTYVDRMQNLSLDILQTIVEANALPVGDRNPMQTIVLSKIEGLIALIEICYNLRFITEDKCVAWVGKALDVKRLNTAWMNRT